MKKKGNKKFNQLDLFDDLANATERGAISSAKILFFRQKKKNQNKSLSINRLLDQ
jgi:hypothetical protein